MPLTCMSTAAPSMHVYGRSISWFLYMHFNNKMVALHMLVLLAQTSPLCYMI
jgi:hypothetical protein